MLYLENSDIHREVVTNGILKARNHIYIATANVKDMHVEDGGKGKYVSITQKFRELCENGVEIRLLYSSNPSSPFLRDLEKTGLIDMENFMMRRCVRCHLKAIIIDGEKVYIGSANLSGAGLGAKREERRNFEMGILSGETDLIDKVTEFFKMIWNRSFCPGCGRRDNCETASPSPDADT